MERVPHKKIIIAGGGTGGHIFPAVAIARAMQRLAPDTDILFVGAKGKMEMEKIPAEGFSIVGLDIAGFNRSSLLKNFMLPVKLIRSLWQARSILRSFKPDIAIGVGGYASFPILFMAQRMKIATLIQEQNSVAGKSNQILGRKAKAICVAYPNMDAYFPKDNIVFTGNPVRQSISNANVSREEAVSFFRLDANQKIIFAFGGSLGAKSINETLATSLQQIVDSKVQLIWQTGNTFYEEACASAKGFENQIKVFAFIREMEYAYAAADVIISRAGALSISELCFVGKPVVFVPFPFASEDHQTQNALTLVKRNAAMMVRDNEVRNDLMKKVLMILSQDAEASLLQKNILALACADADEKIAHQILDII